MVPEATGEIRILYTDDALVAIDKPPGMLIHTSSFDPGARTVTDELRIALGRPVFSVHRLDRMTTGAMVFALTREAAAALSEQFRERSTTKRYLAIVRGHTEEEGVLDEPLPRNLRGDEVEAVTEFVTLSRSCVNEQVGRYDQAWFSLLVLTLRTGRTHQARRHLHRVDHPILGDNRHGDKSYNRWAAGRLGERNLYLRATELAVRHPDGGAVTIRCGFNASWLDALRSLGLEVPEGFGDTSCRRS